jgi:hypothetical protein
MALRENFAEAFSGHAKYIRLMTRVQQNTALGSCKLVQENELSLPQIQYIPWFTSEERPYILPDKDADQGTAGALGDIHFRWN